VIEEKLLPYIVAGLSIHNGPIRSAACKCIKSLSRSVKNLRTSLTDAGIAEPLYKLLFDTNVEVLVMASAAICNIILDFSPIKKSIIDMGGIVRLVELLNSDNQSLQLNAVWGLKNLTFKADIDAKLGVMAKLRWEGLLSLLYNHNLAIQEHALCLMRNLACGGNKVCPYLPQDVDLVFDGFGSMKLTQILEDKINSTSIEILSQVLNFLTPALYVIVNVAVGGLRHKNAIMSSSNILQGLVNHMVL
jgi:armadillo repeat-containing protein 8